MTGKLRILPGVVLLALLALVGCGGGKDATVSGTVKVGDVPLEKGHITFIPVDGKTGTAGAEISNGRYSAKVPVGKMKVTITAPRVAFKKKLYNTPDSPEGVLTAEDLHERYNDKTELTLDVTPGTNNKDWTVERR